MGSHSLGEIWTGEIWAGEAWAAEAWAAGLWAGPVLINVVQAQGLSAERAWAEGGAGLRSHLRPRGFQPLAAKLVQPQCRAWAKAGSWWNRA